MTTLLFCAKNRRNILKEILQKTRKKMRHRNLSRQDLKEVLILLYRTQWYALISDNKEDIKEWRKLFKSVKTACSAKGISVKSLLWEIETEMGLR